MNDWGKKRTCILQEGRGGKEGGEGRGRESAIYLNHRLNITVPVDMALGVSADC